MSLVFQLGTTSADAVTLYPEWNYKSGKKKIESDGRSRGGKLWVYKWGDYDSYKFDVNFVPMTDAQTINSWWDTNTQLLFFISSGSNVDVRSVMLRNDFTPLAQYAKPYLEYATGAIELEGY